MDHEAFNRGVTLKQKNEVANLVEQTAYKGIDDPLMPATRKFVHYVGIGVSVPALFVICGGYIVGEVNKQDGEFVASMIAQSPRLCSIDNEIKRGNRSIEEDGQFNVPIPPDAPINHAYEPTQLNFSGTCIRKIHPYGESFEIEITNPRLFVGTPQAVINLSHS